VVFVWLALCGVVIVVTVAVLWTLTMRQAGGTAPRRAQEDFAAQRADLESVFFVAASNSGLPRGLRWQTIEWQPEVEFAREKATQRLAALVGVTIRFEAIPGGDMEGVAAVGNLRCASAVFFYHAGRWRTSGKALFNLNPDQALARFGGQYERLSEEV
jgi:hypothetical protein